MSASAVISASIYPVGAFLLAVAVVFAMGLALQTENRYGQWLLPSTLPVIGIGIATSTLLSGRNLALADINAAAVSLTSDGFGQGAATWPLRFATLYILAACSALLLAYLFRGSARLPHGRALFVTFAIFFVTNVLTPALLGGKPAFILNHYYPIVVFAAAYVTRDHSPEVLVRLAKVTMLLLLAGSLAAIVISPSLVLQKPYTYGWIPGLQIRLWGLASHANSIGPLALLYMLLAVHQPFRSRWIQRTGIAIALAVLILAQSKTAWVALVVLFAVLFYYRGAAALGQSWRSGRTSYGAISFALAVILGAIGALVAVLALDLSNYWDRFARSTSGGQLFSLTGRSDIWDAAITVWQQNPMFGYGPTLWDPEFRRSIGMSFAFSAHNQLLQSLASAGTVGVIGLVIYLGAVIRYSFLLAGKTLGLSVVLGLFMVLRCMTETPLTTSTLFNGDVLTHLVVFGFLVRERPPQVVKRPTSEDPASRSTMVNLSVSAPT